MRLVDEPDTADLIDEDQRVAHVLSGLPLGEREALALVIWADMSPQQAAFALGCSASALHSRLTRARKRLLTNAAIIDGDLEEVPS